MTTIQCSIDHNLQKTNKVTYRINNVSLRIIIEWLKLHPMHVHGTPETVVVLSTSRNISIKHIYIGKVCTWKVYSENCLPQIDGILQHGTL